MSAKLLKCCCIMLLATTPLLAHHPFSAEYDWKKPVTVTGTVTKVDLGNPHSHIQVDAKDGQGKARSWTFELGNVGALERAGWDKNTVKVGDSITVDAWLARSKNDTGNVKSVKLSNGRELTGASSIQEPILTDKKETGR